MALKNYCLNGPSTVILLDGRNANTSWQNHLNRTRGLRGGVDLVAVIGTPIYAPTAGRWMHRPNNGTAGHSGEFFHDANPGWRDVFSHLSRYNGATNRHFEQGDLIGWTGNSGRVDQHLHRHLLDPQNRRQNPWLHFTPVSATAAGGSTAIILNRKKRNKMNLVWDTSGTGYLVTEDGVMGLGSPQIYNLFYRLINSDQNKSPFRDSGTPDTFNKAEMDIIAANLRLLTASANAQVAIDPVKLASALKDALGTELSVDADIDPKVLAAAFAEAVPRIARAVANEAAKRLAA